MKVEPRIKGVAALLLVEEEGALLEARWSLPRLGLLFSSEPCPFLLLSGRLDHHPCCRRHSSFLIVSGLAIVSPTFVSQNVSCRNMRSTGISFQRSFLGSRQGAGDAALLAGGLSSTYRTLALTFGAHKSQHPRGRSSRTIISRPYSVLQREFEASLDYIRNYVENK